MGLIFGRKKRRSRNTSISSNVPLLRFFGPAFTGTGILGAIFMVFTGRIDLSSLDVLRGTLGVTEESATADVQPVNLQIGQKSNETIRVATFNIQIFGKKKSSNPQVMAVLAKVISQFDVVAIQEVRGGDATPVGALIDLLRASGAQYSATISEPIGRTSQTESYAFVWDESRIQHVPNSAYLVQDPADRMHREPMVASFEARVGVPGAKRPFRFTLINAHTSPSEVTASAIGNEMNVLDDVFVSVRNYDYETSGEEDCIMLGDLNVDTKGLRELGQIPGVESIAKDIKTNTRRSKTYDHILIDRMMTREFTGRFGVLDLQQAFGLSEEQAIQVSDHQPLWAEFNAYEMPRFDPVATAPQTIR
ncbi:MAG: endonuclease/exonuclease/phosphatase family protein [Rubripirellula sp.]